MPLERPAALTFDLRDLVGGFRGVYLVNAVVAFLFAGAPGIAGTGKHPVDHVLPHAHVGRVAG